MRFLSTMTILQTSHVTEGHEERAIARALRRQWQQQGVGRLPYLLWELPAPAPVPSLHQAHLSWRMRTASTGLVKVNSSTSLSLESLPSRASSQISTARQMGGLARPSFRVKGRLG